MVQADFMKSMVNLQKPPETYFTIVKNTMIHAARNTIAYNAIESGFDRVMWFDSDMVVPPDALMRLSADMDNGCEYVTGLYFSRRVPVKPIVYTELLWDGKTDASVANMFDYPDGVTECAASGFGCVLTSVDLLNLVGKRFGSPFAPLDSMGEDLSFCWRVIQCGIKMFCDTSVKCGHVGMYEYNEPAYSIMGAKRDE
jgi:hypothetical protein